MFPKPNASSTSSKTATTVPAFCGKMSAEDNITTNHSPDSVTGVFKMENRTPVEGPLELKLGCEEMMSHQNFNEPIKLNSFPMLRFLQSVRDTNEEFKSKLNPHGIVFPSSGFTRRCITDILKEKELFRYISEFAAIKTEDSGVIIERLEKYCDFENGDNVSVETTIVRSAVLNFSLESCMQYFQESFEKGDYNGYELHYHEEVLNEVHNFARVEYREVFRIPFPYDDFGEEEGEEKS